MPDFSKADFTAIISDLHLCEAEPVRNDRPLWKKYKTRQFFYDDVFQDFLGKTREMAGGRPVELVLNGDIFDFDSVMTLPDHAPYRISWLETKRGLYAQEEKSVFKIEVILRDHARWIEGLKHFVESGNRVIFVIGNHDIELQWPSVQDRIIESMHLSEEDRTRVRFVEWFYISNKDTFIEHGNQHDPYCVATDPVHPFILKFNRLETRLPFGNLACRNIINGMGYFNPHIDTNYILTIREYVRLFFKYMVRTQPLILLTWFGGSVITLWQTLVDHWIPSLKDPLTVEDRIEVIAQKANATPRMVRELKELFTAPAARSPYLVARELWLDRAFLIMAVLLGLFYIVLLVKQILNISVFWMFIPVAMFVPFFLFYARSIRSEVTHYKEPQERVLSVTSLITKVNRVIYGHTHIVRHEINGNVEHLNCGCWSPAFLDVECTKPIDQKTFVWIFPDGKNQRQARLYKFEEGEVSEVLNKKSRINHHQVA